MDRLPVLISSQQQLTPLLICPPPSSFALRSSNRHGWLASAPLFPSAASLRHLSTLFPSPPPSRAFPKLLCASSDPPPVVEEGMPIPGCVTFRRSATQTHFEFFTDLDTLGLRKLSSELSRSLALSMGIKTEKPEMSSTPVAVSVDVTKEDRDLRLQGIVRTSMAVRCSRCKTPFAERVFADFSLLLTDQPVLEPTKQCIGVVLGGGPRMPDEGEEGDEELDLDLDDKLHFPKTHKTIDLSKYIRDTVHLEIPLQPLCAVSCRGICVHCCTNLNIDACKCQGKAEKERKRAIWGPLDQLKKQLDEERKG